ARFAPGGRVRWPRFGSLREDRLALRAALGGGCLSVERAARGTLHRRGLSGPANRIAPSRGHAGGSRRAGGIASSLRRATPTRRRAADLEGLLARLLALSRRRGAVKRRSGGSRYGGRLAEARRGRIFMAPETAAGVTAAARTRRRAAAPR